MSYIYLPCFSFSSIVYITDIHYEEHEGSAVHTPSHLTVAR